MSTTTKEPPTAPQESEHNPAYPHGVAPIDPEKDIDAKSTIIWLSAGLVFVVLCLIVLGQWFGFAIHRQHLDKIDHLPAADLRELRLQEREILWRGLPGAATEMQTDLSNEIGVAKIQERIDAATDQIIDKYVSK